MATTGTRSTRWGYVSWRSSSRVPRGGNVYTQKVMQRKMDQPLMVQNAMLYVWGVIFNGTNWILSAMPSADHHGPPTELFGDVGECRSSPWSSTLSMAYLSPSSSKDSVRSLGRSSTRRHLLHCPHRRVVLGAEITPLELTTFGVIMLAVYLHTVLARNYAPPPPPPPANPRGLRFLAPSSESWSPSWPRRRRDGAAAACDDRTTRPRRRPECSLRGRMDLFGARRV